MPPDVADRIAADIADEHYARRQLLARRTSERARDRWSQVDRKDITGSWASLSLGLFRDITLAQIESAATADAYIDSIIGSIDTAGAIQPRALAGVASDGRTMMGLLQSPAVTTIIGLAHGQPLDSALDQASRQLGMIVGTQIQDAGRVADGVGVATRERAGYIRKLRTPSCSRCAILAAKFYRWNHGFLRHPRCDCQHVPSTNSTTAETFDSATYFESLSTADQDRTFTIAGARAIRDGADIGQVVNARRGMTSAGTTAGARRGRVRLMPEQIYATNPTRSDAVTALRRAGYIA